MDYTQVPGATSENAEELRNAMQALVGYAQSQTQFSSRLSDSIQMWRQTGEWLTGTIEDFSAERSSVLGYWQGKDDGSKPFETETGKSITQMNESKAKISPGPIAALEAALKQLPDSCRTVGEQATAFNSALDSYNAATNPPSVAPGDVGTGTATAQLIAIRWMQQAIRAAGEALNKLRDTYVPATAAVTKAGEGHEWSGPKSGHQPNITPDENAGAPGRAPSGSPTGAPTGDPAQDAGQDQAQAGQDPAQAGADQQDAGGGQDGQTSGETGTQGPSLSGVGGVPPVTVPPPGTGTTVPPVSSVPFRPPVNGFEPFGISQIPGMGNAAYGPVNGAGKSGGLGGVVGPGRSGVGGIDGTKGVGDSKIGQVSNGGLDRQIPQAAKPGPSSTPLSGGQAPGAAGFSGGGPSAAQAGGAGGVPPMMPPPMMPGGMGGGRTARTGGPVRSGGPGRARPGGPPPGVPAALRGRTGRPDATGMVPAAAAADRNRRRQRSDDVNTLQLLDEELWTVDNTTPEAQQEARRLAN